MSYKATKAVLFALLFCVICVLRLWVVLVRLSMPVERLVFEMSCNVLMGTLIPTHSLTHFIHSLMARLHLYDFVVNLLYNKLYTANSQQIHNKSHKWSSGFSRLCENAARDRSYHDEVDCSVVTRLPKLVLTTSVNSRRPSVHERLLMTPLF